MAVTITIDVSPPEPIIPPHAQLDIDYGCGCTRRLVWTYQRTQAQGQNTMHDIYHRVTTDENGLVIRETEETLLRVQHDGHPVPDPRPMFRQIERNLGSTLSTILAAATTHHEHQPA